MIFDVFRLSHALLWAMTLHISTGDVSGRLRLRDCQAARLPLASLLVRHMGVSIEKKKIPERIDRSRVGLIYIYIYHVRIYVVSTIIHLFILLYIILYIRISIYFCILNSGLSTENVRDTFYGNSLEVRCSMKLIGCIFVTYIYTYIERESMIYTIIIYNIYWTAGGTCRIGACNVCIIFDAWLAVQHSFPKILQLATDLVTQHVEVYLASFLWAKSLDTQGVEHWVVSRF